MSKGYLEPIDVRSKGGVVRPGEKEKRTKDIVDDEFNIIEHHEIGDFKNHSAKVEKVGGIHKAKRKIKIAQKRENLESGFMAMAVRAQKQERNKKNNARKKAKKLAKRRK